MWVYSKGPELSLGESAIPADLKQYTTFPDAPVPHRSVQQIDLVPSLSLLLGLPIPFNNLGTVIPEFFWRDKAGSAYREAISLNSRQIHNYLDTYRGSSAGGELDAVWNDLQNAWSKITATMAKDNLHQHVAYTRLALETCRSLWAQFNVGLMGFGLTILVLSVGVALIMYQYTAMAGASWDAWVEGLTRAYLLSAAGGATIGATAWMPSQAFATFKGISLLQFILFGACLGSSVSVLSAARPKFTPSWTLLITVLHAIAFFSNSYTFWEERIITFFLLSTLVPPFLASFSAPTTHLRWRILFFCGVFAACVRLMAISTVCREEQHPWCSIAYFAGGTVAEPPKLVLALALPACAFVPWYINRQLATSKSNNSLAALFLPYILAPTLLAGTAYWILEWLDSMEFVADTVDFRLARTVLGRSGIAGMLIAGGLLWTLVPGESESKTQVLVLGFANAFGSPYLIFWTISLGIVWIATQLTGQLTLGLATVALLAHLELTDGVRDARALQLAFDTNPSAALALLHSQGSLTAAPTLAPGDTRVRFAEIAPLALLALHAFYTTGHQATIPSIQWKAVFVLSPRVSYPLAPALFAANTFGPVFLLALAVPLLALWNVPPLTPDTPGSAPSALSGAPALMLARSVPRGSAAT
ncbi:hypothetical protein EVG20_g2336 [Dentipellis fragilis]|uniref:GPI ethanolamine phosphate transferase 1 n=1 Tax=Dentipellis fragilis TaxID=205917 RepID=A0A4Y9ZBB3_9AGAM|nr:hypothetical protein EVG20_g2336 [Dentipellis fragilis]